MNAGIPGVSPEKAATPREGRLAAEGLTPERERAVLHERARQLARVPVVAEDGGLRLEVVEFMLAHEHYAIESKFVREVFSLKNLTPIPCVPPFVLGITNVRGGILSVVNMHLFFELPDRGITNLSKVVVLHSKTMEFGVLADVVLGTRWLAADSLQPPLPTLTGIREEYLKGLTSERLIVLDGERLLGSERLVVKGTEEL